MIEWGMAFVIATWLTITFLSVGTLKPDPTLYDSLVFIGVTWGLPFLAAYQVSQKSEGSP